MEPTRLTSVFTAMRATLFSRAKRVLGNSDDADDALQEAFCRIWRHRDDIRTDLDATRLSNVALNSAAIDMLRRRQAHPMTEIPDSMSCEPCTSDTSDTDSLFEQVDRIVEHSLGERERKILRMREMHGYDYAEIAEMFDTTEVNIRMIVSRARRTVREIYRKNCEL